MVHVPEILYHWRTHKASTADNPASKMYAFEAGKEAIEAHLERVGVKGTCQPHSRSWVLPGKVSGSGTSSGIHYHSQ